MAGLDGPEFEMSFFTWRRALWGRYDIFHLHWPEQLLAETSGIMGRVRLLRARALVARLRWRKTAVVYTVHNPAPDQFNVSAQFFRFYSQIVELAELEIHLVPEPDRITSTPAITIPHGSYREPFAAYVRDEAQPGHAMFFGILKKYKGIERLVEEFTSVEDPDIRLRIVGEPKVSTTVRAVDDSIRKDARISSRYGFIPDSELVAEVSAAGLVVLPYTEFHSSGAALVALSLDRPILIPSSPTADALRDEVGREWVRVFAPPLTASALAHALEIPIPRGRPNLDHRAWDVVRREHTKAYRALCERSHS